MTYVLEDENEFDRLERQAQTPLYDPRRELEGFDFSKARRILDAGCGSGIVSRILAEAHPSAQVLGVDLSQQRVQRANAAGCGLQNLRYAQGSVTKLPESENAFDAIVCRFVLEHLPKTEVQAALAEFYRCLKPGGHAVAIDLDGLYHNLYPQTASIRRFIAQLDRSSDIDMQVGRKLPAYLTEAGFVDVSWRIDTMEMRGTALDTEAQLIQERFAQALPAMSALMNSEEEAKTFQRDFLATLRQPGSVLFYNKFIVSGIKPKLLRAVGPA